MCWPFVSLLLAGVMAAGPVTFRASSTPEAAVIVMEWSDPVGYTTSIVGRELSLRFDRPLTLAPGTDLGAMLPNWIEAATTGFDTLLIRARGESTYAVRADGPRIVIELRVAQGQPTASPEDRLGELRLDLLRAQLLFAEGRWTRADRILAGAAARDPGAREVRNLRREVRSDQGSRTQFEFETKDVQRAQSERMVRLTARGLVGYTKFGGAIEVDRVTLGGQAFERQRAELLAQHNFDSGGELRLSAFGTRLAVGGGVHYAQAGAGAKTEVAVEYRRPYWEYVEGLAAYGTRNRGEIRREQRIGPRVSTRAGAAMNQYGLGTADRVGQSASFDAGLDVTLLKTNPDVVVEYAVDVESRRFSRPDTIPLVSREVHAGSVIVHHRVGRWLLTEAFSGYATDRLGGQSPFFGARVIRTGSGRLGFHLWVDRRLQSVATGQTVSRAGANLQWRFD